MPVHLQTARRIVGGLRTYIPGMYCANADTLNGSFNAHYCYSVWLRHLSIAHMIGLDTNPKTVLELGPGDSIGTGLAALLTGADRYIGLDLGQQTETERNLSVFDELVRLFAARAPIQGAEESPRMRPRLESYEFPHELLTRQRMSAALDIDRLCAIRRSIAEPGFSNRFGINIHYHAPWCDPEIVSPESVDMVFSQAVLQHVDDLPRIYAAQRRWLRPGGFISHTINFGSHGQAECWNGHWAYSELTLRLIRGRRVYLLNRAPHSEHLRLLKNHGFELVCDLAVEQDGGIQRCDLDNAFKHLSDRDLRTSGTFVQAVRI